MDVLLLRCLFVWHFLLDYICTEIWCVKKLDSMNPEMRLQSISDGYHFLVWIGATRRCNEKKMYVCVFTGSIQKPMVIYCSCQLVCAYVCVIIISALDSARRAWIIIITISHIVHNCSEINGNESQSFAQFKAMRIDMNLLVKSHRKN